MKKLLDLKQWLTVPDAARHLSILFGEEVREADVFQLALEGHLTLSVYFLNGALGRCGPLIPLSEEHFLEHSIWIDENRVIDCGPELKRIEGIWDLSMLGFERIEIENLYQNLANGPLLVGKPWPGPIVCGEDGPYCQIQRRLLKHELVSESTVELPYYHSDNYCQADSLPADCILVVRTSALRALEARRSVPNQIAEKPLGKRERETLLVIIAALAKMAKIDVTRPSAAAAAIGSQTVLMGAGVSPRAIEDHLKRIPGALEEFK